MVTKRLLTTFLAGLMSLQAYKGPAHAQPASLILMYDDLEPYVIVRGAEISGYLADYLLATARAAQVDLVWSHTHWDKQIPILRESKKNVCAIGLYKTEERLTYLRFSEPIGTDEGLVLVGINDHTQLKKHQNFKAVIDDSTLTPILQVHSTYGPYVNSLLKDKSFPITRGSLERIVRTLQNGTHDYMMLTPLAAHSMKERFGLAIYDHYPDLQNDLPYYLGCSKAVDDNIFGRLNAEFLKRGPSEPR